MPSLVETLPAPAKLSSTGEESLQTKAWVSSGLNISQCLAVSGEKGGEDGGPCFQVWLGAGALRLKCASTSPEGLSQTQDAGQTPRVCDF